jgi:hypothetical protein
MIAYLSNAVLAMPTGTIAELDARSRAIYGATVCGTCGAELGQGRTVDSDLCGPCVQAIDDAEWERVERREIIKHRRRKR